MIKATIQLKEKKEDLIFPFIGVTPDGRIVLFSAYGCGVILEDGRNFISVGRYDTDWRMDAFAPFSGTVTLEQE